MELKPYHLRITFDVQVAPWRIDDPKELQNANWSLWVLDMSKKSGYHNPSGPAQVSFVKSQNRSFR